MVRDVIAAESHELAVARTTVSQTAPERVISWDTQKVMTEISAYSPAPSTKRFRAVDLRR